MIPIEGGPPPDDSRYLVYVAGWKHHIVVSRSRREMKAFQRALAPYRSGKSTVRFPLGDHRAEHGRLPEDLR